ncbi:NarK/NasA family nitrate transporter [Lichenicola cladoniae]|uniref:NarK/NasA family nitrate transporter n=1 Tax=Lichenicola cladoniae TaxID=1484109 RepID=A0A6M8H8T4_9PROT|nr:nitrate/nitrite transporter [Lichenicola cladoniae]NPD68578.1 NarK/NasA family nitrate transporter [Acetobacteraceae bacterium]QKE88943.1 NarK/NasA family nitrate transporter [Lichenicola cladoniae]
MINRAFLKAGHLPTLFSAFFYFDMAFMVWVLLGPLGVQIAHALHLNPAQKGLMVAVPILSGALLRVVAGLLVDRLRPKRTGIIAQCIVLVTLLAVWLFGIPSYSAVLILGMLLGVAGASFAVALPLASRWYPPQYQGIALGIAGAGNSGTVFAALFAPLLAARFGWTTVFGLAAIPVAIAFVTYLVLARDAPNPPAPRHLHQYADVLRDRDAWWFMLFYGVTFGGFSGLASSLTIYFNADYGLGPVLAGECTAACVFAGSMVRPLGGALADRIGGIRSLSVMYGVAAVALLIVSTHLPTLGAALVVFIVAMLAFGMGNGAVFQLVPQRFAREIGVMTGLVGMAGGVGGFLLAFSLGTARQYAGAYGPGFLIFAVLALVALFGLMSVKSRWRTTWGALPGVARI